MANESIDRENNVTCNATYGKFRKTWEVVSTFQKKKRRVGLWSVSWNTEDEKARAHDTDFLSNSLIKFPC